MDHDADGDTARPGSSPLAGRYRILSRLGSGGMADVYLARDEDLGRLVAVKVLKEELAADAVFVERFRIEAEAAASLNHPAIVAVYDRGRAGPSPYIVMEYVDGESLRQRLRRTGRLSAPEAGAVALAVLQALQAAHEHRIVHRDVTTANVLFDGAGRVKVADFGIARMGESVLTHSGAMLGTSSYLSPEQAQGRPADERSDLYSLGVVLYQMLTGRLPFRGDSDVAVALQHVSTAPPNPRSLVPDVPETYAAVTMRALSKRPEDRYQSAPEFARALREAGGGGARAGAPTQDAPAGTRGAGVRPAAAAMPAEAVPAAAGAGVAAAGSAAAGRPSDADRAEAHSAAGRPVEVRPAKARPGEPPSSVARSPRAGIEGTPSVEAGSLVAGASVAARRPSAPRRPAPPGSTVVAADALTRPMAATRRVEAEEAPPVARRRRRWRRWLVLVAALAVAGTAAWAVYAFVLSGGVKVPALVGQESGQAVAALRKHGLKPVAHEIWSDRYDAGVVARQRPRSGTKVEDGVQVDLWVSRGPLHIPAPSLAGLTARQARSRLEQATLTPRKRRSATLSAPRGKVYRQEPAAGETVTRGDTVTFWVSSGPPMVTVPDVVDLSSGDAKAALEAKGFVATQNLVAGWGTFPGHVVEQDPAAGTRLRKGDEVVIKVAVF